MRLRSRALVVSPLLLCAGYGCASFGGGEDRAVEDVVDSGSDVGTPSADAGSDVDEPETAPPDASSDTFDTIDLKGFPTDVESARFTQDELSADVTTLAQTVLVMKHQPDGSWQLTTRIETTEGPKIGFGAMISADRRLIVYEQDYDVVLRTGAPDGPYNLDTSTSPPNAAEGTYWGSPYLDEVNKLVYFNQRSRTAGDKSGTLFLAPLASDNAFGAPAVIQGSTPNALRPVASRDRRYLYFAHDNPKSNKYELWEMRRNSADEPFGSAQPIVALANGDDDGRYPTWTSADGQTLYFIARKAGVSRIVRAERHRAP